VLAMLVIAVLSLFCSNYSIPEPLIAIHILFVNLATDSLPAIALGYDDKAKNIMDDKPRDPKESLFAKGGYAISFGYGFVIALITLIAFFWTPVFCCGDITFNLNEIALRLAEFDNCLIKSQTMAFSTLAIAELFHMLGMTNIKKSFVCNFKGKNWLLFVAFAVGIALQVFVVMTPGVNTIFKCYPLTWEWIVVVCLSLLPLVIHEIVALIIYIVNKVIK
jgi:Ca2+-transporting ATPase